MFRSAVEKAGLEARRRLRAARRAGLRRPRHVGEDRPEPSLQRVQVHVRGRDRESRCARAATASSCASATRASAFAEADLPKMFQRFQRVRNARSRTHEGSGIGLALVRELVENPRRRDRGREPRARRHDVHRQLAEGQGAFAGRANRRRAPACVDADSAPHPFLEEALRGIAGRGGADTALGSLDESTAPPQAASGERARILLADDNADMRDYVRRLLERHYEVVAVERRAASARRRSRTELPDLVLTDVMMPRLDGFGLWRRSAPTSARGRCP